MMHVPKILEEPYFVKPSWPTMIFSYEWRDFEHHKDALKEFIYKEYEKQDKDIDSEVAPNIKAGMIESKFDFLEKDHPSVKALKNFCLDSLFTMFVRDIKPFYDIIPPERFLIDIAESWYHIANNKAYHGVHTHPGMHWAGIFYIQTDECDRESGNGTNTFYNYAAAIGSTGLGQEHWAKWNAWVPDLKDGTLILFPTHVPHDAAQYEGEEDRIVVAFNSRIDYPNIE